MSLRRRIVNTLLSYTTLLLIISTFVGIGIKGYLFYKASQLEYPSLAFNSQLRDEILKEAQKFGISPYEYYMKYIAPKRHPELKMNPIKVGMLSLWEALKSKEFKNEFNREVFLIPPEYAVLRTILLLFLSETIVIILGFYLAKWAVKSHRVFNTVHFLARIFNGIPVWWIGAMFIMLIINSSIPTDLVRGLLTTNLKETLVYLIFPTISIVLVSIWEFADSITFLLKEELGKEYVMSKKAIGLPERVINKHVLRGIAVPFLSIALQHIIEVETLVLVIGSLFYLFDLGTMLHKGFFIETGGIGGAFRFSKEAFLFPVAVLLILNFILSIAVDILSSYLEPRRRKE